MLPRKRNHFAKLEGAVELSGRCVDDDGRVGRQRTQDAIDHREAGETHAEDTKQPSKRPGIAARRSLLAATGQGGGQPNLNDEIAAGEEYERQHIYKADDKDV